MQSSTTSVVLENLRQLRRDAAVSELKSVLDQFPELAHEAGIHLVQRMTPQNRQVRQAVTQPMHHFYAHVV